MKKHLRLNRNREDLQEFIFDVSEARQLQWEDEEEFLWRGEMYDVVSKKMDGEKLVITCIADKDEDRLLNEYQRTTEHNQAGSKSSLVKFTVDNFVQPVSLEEKQYAESLQQSFSELSAELVFRPSTIISPPPKVC